jgi:hypothetical protein
MTRKKRHQGVTGSNCLTVHKRVVFFWCPYLWEKNEVHVKVNLEPTLLMSLKSWTHENTIHQMLH